jgi:hypothetical protein
MIGEIIKSPTSFGTENEKLHIPQVIIFNIRSGFFLTLLEVAI